MREIRGRAGDVEDKEKGVKIDKKDWEKLHLHIASHNNFPTAAGLASSAAGFACLGIFLTFLSLCFLSRGLIETEALQIIDFLHSFFALHIEGTTWFHNCYIYIGAYSSF